MGKSVTVDRTYHKRKTKTPKQAFEDKGIYFIDQGRCTIVFRSREVQGKDPDEI